MGFCSTSVGIWQPQELALTADRGQFLPFVVIDQLYRNSGQSEAAVDFFFKPTSSFIHGALQYSAGQVFAPFAWSSRLLL